MEDTSLKNYRLIKQASVLGDNARVFFSYFSIKTYDAGTDVLWCASNDYPQHVFMETEEKYPRINVHACFKYQPLI